MEIWVMDFKTMLCYSAIVYVMGGILKLVECQQAFPRCNMFDEQLSVANMLGLAKEIASKVSEREPRL